LILDTCASGRVIDELTGKRQVSADHIRACERMRDSAGLHVLAGCAADRVSYEASHYGQGLVTYALLWGMRGGALQDGQFVDVGKLFGFAERHVPILARDLNGLQKPVRFSRQEGGAFYVGEVTAGDRERIPLHTPRPFMLPSRFFDEVQIRDALELEVRIDRRLRDFSEADAHPVFVFTDAQESSDSYRLDGKYRVKGQQVTVVAKLHYGSEEVATVPLSGATKDEELDALSERIAAEAIRRIEAHVRRAAGSERSESPR
jgi:hypothetical protein